MSTERYIVELLDFQSVGITTQLGADAFVRAEGIGSSKAGLEQTVFRAVMSTGHRAQRGDMGIDLTS